jgi:hypothetical protein
MIVHTGVDRNCPNDHANGIDMSGAELPLKPSSTRPARFAASLAGLIALAFLAATFQVGFNKDLVKTITPEEWGRYLFGISAAITELKFGIGWFASSEYVEGALQQGGLTADPTWLKPLGVDFPENLKDPQVLQSALEKAWAMPHATNKPEAEGYYNALRGASGDDVGLSTYTILGFLLFGRDLPALYYLYFAMIAASMLLYTLSHGRSIAAMTVLALGMMALYVIAASDLVNYLRKVGYFAGQSGLDFKDPRYLSTLALIPTLHIIVGWLRPQHRFRALDFATLAGQSVILTFAIHVRASTQWIVIALALFWLVLIGRVWWRSSATLVQSGRSLSLIAVGMIVLILAMGHFVAVLMAHPLYKLQGDLLTHPFWRGVYYSMQDNYDWAAKYGATVDGATGDDMPVVAVKKAIAKLPADQQRQYLGRHGYPTMAALEKFSKALFFDLLRQDPKFVYDTYFVARYQLLIDRMGFFYGSLRQTTSPWQAAALVGALLILIWVASSQRGTLVLLASFTGIAASFAVLACLPNWLVSVEEGLMVDHFSWGLIFAFASIALVGVTLAGLTRRATQALPILHKTRAGGCSSWTCRPISASRPATRRSMHPT